MHARESELSHLDDSIIMRGRQVYERQIKSRLEPEQIGRFIAIEPESGRYFLGETGTMALLAARGEMPEEEFYLARIGYHTADAIGGSIRRGE